MATIANLAVKLTGSTSNLITALDKAESRISKFGDRASTLGSKMTKGITLPFIAGMGLATKSAAAFDEKMALLQTQAGASADEVRNMSAAVLDMAGQVTATPDQLADALFHIESAGISGSKALDMLKVAAEGAMVGQADLTDVTNAMIATVTSGVKGVSDMTDGMSQLNAIVGAGNMKMQDLTGAMGTGILSAAANFGLSLKDVGAALDTMTIAGIPAEDAATRLRMTFSMMGAPTGKAADALARIGLTSTQLAEDMRNKGIIAAVQDLKDHLTSAGLSATEQAAVLTEAFGGGRTSSAIMTLVQNLDTMKGSMDRINNTTGNFGANIDEAQAQPMARFKESLAKIDASLIKLGNVTLPIVADSFSSLAGMISTLADRFATLNPTMQHTVLIAFSLVAAFGPLIWTAGKMIKTFSTLMTIFGVLGSIAGAISGAFETLAIVALYLWDAISGSAIVGLLAEAFSALVGVVEMVAIALGVSFGTAVAIVAAVVVAVIAVIAGLIYYFTHFDEVNQAVAAAIGAAWGWLKDRWGEFVDFVEGLGGSILDWFSNLGDTIWNAMGSAVNAVGNAAQAIPGRLAGLAKSIISSILAGLRELPYKVGYALGRGLMDMLIGLIYVVGYGIVVGLTLIKYILLGIKGGIHLVVAATRAIVTGIWNVLSAIPGIVIGIFTVVTGFIASLPGVIMGFVTAAVGAIIGFITWLPGAAAQIPAIVGGALAAMAAVAAAAFWSILSAASSAFWSIVGAVSGAVGAIVGAVSSAVGSVVSFFASLPGQIIGALGDVGHMLWDAGTQIVQGLIDGIKSKIGDALGAMGSLGSQIKDKFTDIMSIFSPSRVMMKFGRFIVEGLAIGIGNNTHLVQKAMDTVAGIANPQSGTPMQPAFAGAAGAPQVIPMSAAPGSAGATNFTSMTTVEAGALEFLKRFIRSEIQEANRDASIRSRSNLSSYQQRPR